MSDHTFVVVSEHTGRGNEYRAGERSIVDVFEDPEAAFDRRSSAARSVAGRHTNYAVHLDSSQGRRLKSVADAPGQ